MGWKTASKCLVAVTMIAGCTHSNSISQSDQRAGDQASRAQSGEIKPAANEELATEESMDTTRNDQIDTQDLPKTDAEWKKLLSDEAYYVTRKKGTEQAFTGKYWNNKASGIYRCVCCGNPLFSSQTKYDSGTGWPSFWKPVTVEAVSTESDNTLFMKRTEVLCSKCDAHLGHVFEDGPEPSGLRYCINSVSLDFDKAKEDAAEK